MSANEPLTRVDLEAIRDKLFPADAERAEKERWGIDVFIDSLLDSQNVTLAVPSTHALINALIRDKVRAGVLHMDPNVIAAELIASGVVTVVEAETPYVECKEELHSWSYFSPNQTDSYWMGCHLTYPHTEHENSETGAKWRTDDEGDS